jgi:hypothetical protein
MSIVKIQINHTKNLNKATLATHLYDEIGEIKESTKHFMRNLIDV